MQHAVEHDSENHSNYAMSTNVPIHSPKSICYLLYPLPPLLTLMPTVPSIFS